MDKKQKETIKLITKPLWFPLQKIWGCLGCGFGVIAKELLKGEAEAVWSLFAAIGALGLVICGILKWVNISLFYHYWVLMIIFYLVLFYARDYYKRK